jgi:hypothetical protein
MLCAFAREWDERMAGIGDSFSAEKDARMFTDFWYLEHAIFEKDRDDLLEPVLNKTGLWMSLRSGCLRH